MHKAAFLMRAWNAPPKFSPCCQTVCNPCSEPSRIRLNVPGNIGNVELEGDAVVCYISVRSCKGSLIDQMCGKYRAVAELTGCALTFRDRLPGWDYDRDSRLRRLVDKEYNERFGSAPRFKVTHASTECGMFKEQLPHMDIISMGPIIYEEHTPRSTWESNP